MMATFFNLKQKKIPLLCLYLSLALLLLSPSQSMAIPTLFDQWTFYCGAGKVTREAVEKASSKVREKTGDFAVGVSLLKYGCLQYLYENDRYQARLKAYEKRGSSKAKPPVLNHKISLSIVQDARRNLEVAANKKKKPHTLYYYGLSLALSGDALAVNIFDTLMTKFKKHKFASKASLALGDFYLDNQQVEKARNEYENVIKNGKKDVSTYAKYKLSWLDFALALNSKNKFKQRQAVGSLLEVEQEAKKGNKLMQRLSENVKKDILEILAAIGDTTEARRILKQIDSMDTYYALLEKMAEFQINAGEFSKAYALYEELLKERKIDANNYKIAEKMIRLSTEMNKTDLIFKNLREYINVYADEKSDWVEKQDKKIIHAAHKNAESLLFEYATSFDQEGVKTKQKSYFNIAAQLYRIFLKSFPKSNKAYDIRLYLGQLYNQMQNYKGAALILKRMIEKYPKGKFNRDASEVMIYAAQSYMDADKNQYTLPKPGMATREIKLPVSRKLFVDCSKIYVQLNPKGKDTPTVYFASATALFDFGHYKDANELYHLYIDMQPQSEYAATAALRILFTAQKTLSRDLFEASKKRIAKYANLKANPEIAPYFVNNNKSANRAATRKQLSRQEGIAEEGQQNLSPTTTSSPSSSQGSDQEDDWQEVE
ncbi:MAG: tetratricopeptide repeat protein [Bdellovibrionota bacterium]